MAAVDQQQQLRRRAQAAGAGAAEEDPFFGHAVDLEGQAAAADDKGAGLARAVGGAMVDSGFGLDWDAVAKEAATAVPVSVTGEVGGDVDKGVLVDAMTERSHWPFCAWDATTYVYY